MHNILPKGSKIIHSQTKRAAIVLRHGQEPSGRYRVYYVRIPVKNREWHGSYWKMENCRIAEDSQWQEQAERQWLAAIPEPAPALIPQIVENPMENPFCDGRNIILDYWKGEKR